MGAHFSRDIRYMYVNGVPVPYVRLASGQWVPLQQLQNSYVPPYGSPRPWVANSIVHPLTTVRASYPK